MIDLIAALVAALCFGLCYVLGVLLSAFTFALVAIGLTSPIWGTVLILDMIKRRNAPED